MRFLAMTDPGCEAACAIEVQRILGKQARREGGLVLFEATLEEACTFTWRTQTAQRVLLDIGAPQRLEHARFLSGTFKVVGERIEETATWLLNETRLTVNLTAPDVTIVTRGPYTGLDLGGELWKRDWRVMLSNHSLKATIAASAVVYGGVTGRIVDPYCDDGTLAIETMLLLTGTSPRQHAKRLPFERWCLRESTRAEEVVPVRAFAETFRDTKAVRMNSKLAGVPVDVTKGAWSAEAPVDGIITSLLRSKHVNVRERLVRLSRQTTALAQGGRLVCVTQRSERIRLGGLDPVDTYDVLMGKSPLTIHVYARP